MSLPFVDVEGSLLSITLLFCSLEIANILLRKLGVVCLALHYHFCTIELISMLFYMSLRTSY
jgi:hypothetical protein